MKIGHLTMCCALLLSTVLHAQTDQTLEWASYFGGSNPWDPMAATMPTQIKEAPDGGFYACGWTDAQQGIVVPPAHQVGMFSFTGFFMKIGADKNIEYASYFGGEDQDSVNDLAVLSDGSFVIVGSTRSFQEIATAGSFMETKPTGDSGFIARFNANGQIIWSTYLGGDAPELSIGTTITSVIADENDNIICVGITNSENLPVTDNAHQTTIGGAEDGFVARFDSDGNPDYISYIGGEGNDRLFSVALIPNGDILLGGTTNSESQIATPNGYQTELGGQRDAFMMRMSFPDGMIWGTYYGGDEDDYIVRSPVFDGDNHFYALIGTRTQGLETMGLPYDEIGNIELRLVTRFNLNGEPQWSRYLNYDAWDGVSGLQYCGETLVAFGMARLGHSSIAMGVPFQPAVNGVGQNPDMFLQGIASDGQLLWGTYYGGLSVDAPYRVQCLEKNRILLAGSTSSTSIEITPDAFQPTKSGWINALFAIFEIDGLTNVEHNEELTLKAYPNPTTQHLWLDLPPSFAFHAEVSVYNSVGQLVQRHTQFSSHEPLSLQHPPGLYIVEARKGDNAVRAKVVVR